MARWLVVPAACGLTLAAAMAVAQECPEIVAVLPYGSPDVVAVDGVYAYFGIGRGLLVVDQSDPTDLRSVARLAMPGTVRGIAVAGARAYLSLGEAGLRVVDVSDPTDPRVVQAIATPGEAQGVAVAGDLLFVASGSAGLCAVSPTADPPVLGCVDTFDAHDVDIAGTLAVVADGANGLKVVNVSDPAQLVVLGSVPMDARAVKAQGHLAFVASYEAGLRVVDVSNPSNPVQIGQLDTPRYCYDLDVVENLVLLADYPRLTLVDVSTPSSPVEVGSLSGVAVVGVAAHGHHATVAATDWVTVVDISAPTLPQEVGRLGSGPAFLMAAEGNLAVLQGYEAAVVVISPRGEPREVSVIDSRAWDLELSGTYLYLTTTAPGHPQHSQLEVFDVSDPTSPVQIAVLEFPVHEDALAFAGDLLALGVGELRLIDVSTPWDPIEVGLLSEPPSGWGYWTAMYSVAGIPGYVYRGGEAFSAPQPQWRWGWSEVIDVTDPAMPAYWDYPLQAQPDIPCHLRVHDGTLLALGTDSFSSSGWIGIYDLSEPLNPQWTHGGELSSGCGGYITTGGQLLFHTAPSQGVVRVYDLHAPWDPAGIAEVSLPAPYGLATLGRHLLVADAELGLVVLDTTCVGGMFADGFESGGTAAWSEVWP